MGKYTMTYNERQNYERKQQGKRIKMYNELRKAGYKKRPVINLYEAGFEEIIRSKGFIPDSNMSTGRGRKEQLKDLRIVTKIVKKYFPKASLALAWAGSGLSRTEGDRTVIEVKYQSYKEREARITSSLRI